MLTLKKLSLMGGSAVGAVALTLGTAGLAGAQDAPAEDPAPVEETIEESTTEEGTDERAERRAARQERKDATRAAIAEIIGKTVEEIKELREAGSTLAEIAGDELPAVIDYKMEQITERVEARVADGTITQEQADERLEGLEERVEERLENGRSKADRKNRRAALRNAIVEAATTDA